MFKRKTLFVLGAGASAELGLPTGAELARTIHQKANVTFDDELRCQAGDGDLFWQFLASEPDPKPRSRPWWHRIIDPEMGRVKRRYQFQDVAWTIAEAVLVSRSIDDVLDIHQNNYLAQRFAKMAIVKAILEAERHSPLNRKNSKYKLFGALAELRDTWLVRFFAMLSADVQRESVHRIFENVSFVVFNYDRCFECFLLTAIQGAYHLTNEELFSICERLTILHPYGTVGDLYTVEAPNGVAFGGSGKKTVSDNLLVLHGNIKTYTERALEETVLNAIRSEVMAAECVVFLGFGFHARNMELLTPSASAKTKVVYATAHGLSSDALEMCAHQIRALFDESAPVAVNIRSDLTCRAFFDETPGLSAGEVAKSDLSSPIPAVA